MPWCCLEGDFVCSDLVWHCDQIHIGSGAAAPVGLSSLPLRYINFYHSIFEFHINFLHSIFIYTSTCSPSSFLRQRSVSSRQPLSSEQHSGPMAKPGSPAAASQAAGSTALDGGITKDSFIPLFDGQPQSFQEWRKHISIYHVKMKIQKRSVESTLTIIGSLQGTA